MGCWWWGFGFEHGLCVVVDVVNVVVRFDVVVVADDDDNAVVVNLDDVMDVVFASSGDFAYWFVVAVHAEMWEDDVMSPWLRCQRQRVDYGNVLHEEYWGWGVKCENGVLAVAGDSGVAVGCDAE